MTKISTKITNQRMMMKTTRKMTITTLQMNDDLDDFEIPPLRQRKTKKEVAQTRKSQKRNNDESTSQAKMTELMMKPYHYFNGLLGTLLKYAPLRNTKRNLRKNVTDA